jgi:hypothetical protein
MTSGILIGLTGKKGAGKNTFAIAPVFKDYLELAFAEPLKDYTQVLYGLTDEQLHGPTKKNEVILDSNGVPVWFIEGQSASPRKIFQWLGTDVIREYLGPDFFVDLMRDRIIGLQTPDGSREIVKVIFSEDIAGIILQFLGPVNIIVTDVRFNNEGTLIKNLGGTVAEIRNPTLVNTDTHASEQGISPSLVDYFVTNDPREENSLEKLFKRAEKLVKLIKGY